ncbi:hypothetical protein [Paenibacillus donghaensis]|uniref:Carrier domain-containing protein n=1 Tax=Paenibacillus donghaensis TaxID=414771 RepID=A0A2Z2KEX5_9BACL|nr:hypothetical protein [Paenibacillus donghaensis]ASA25346.1 hypothetical protein B9T62_34210 [Paenibacillus donghaensis]
MYLEIERKLLNIIEENYGKKIVDVNEKLLNRNINLKPVELASLLVQIEEFFLVKISNEDITNGNFDSVGNISKLITQRLSEPTNYN